MLPIYMALIDDEEDKKTFENFYNRNSNIAYAVAYKILQNESLAEEACAEAFFSIAKCFKKIHKFSLHDMDAYLIRTIKNACYAIHNKEKRISQTSFDDLIGDSEPSDDCFDDIDLNLLIDAIQKLDDSSKSVIAYKIYYGLTADEIAEHMGVSKRTVFNYLNRAKQQINEFIGGEKNER